MTTGMKSRDDVSIHLCDVFHKYPIHGVSHVSVLAADIYANEKSKCFTTKSYQRLISLRCVKKREHMRLLPSHV